MRRGLRLRKGSQFKKVYEEGRKVVGNELVLHYLGLDGRDQTKIGFSVSKKVGGAVARNKTRRRLRNIIEEKHARLKSGYFLVFVVRPTATDRSYSDLGIAVDRLLKRAELLKRVK